MVGGYGLRLAHASFSLPRYGLGSLGFAPNFFWRHMWAVLGYLLSRPTVHTRTPYLIEKPPEKYFGRVPGSIVAAITAPQSRSPIAIFLTLTTPGKDDSRPLDHDVEGHPPCADVRAGMLRNGQRQSLTSSPGHRSLLTLFSREFLALAQRRNARPNARATDEPSAACRLKVCPPKRRRRGLK